jgi:predicted GH43/DUF377 family glycosyl hydrolase
MQWLKQGIIYRPDGAMIWAQQYASLPTPLLLNDNRLRIFISSCDQNMVGRVGYVDVNPSNPKEILSVSKQPVLDIGQPGCFDENGVMPTCILHVGDELYMYYVGYQLGYKVRYFQFGGLAISRDGGETFHRFQTVPIIDRSHTECMNRTGSFVMQENGHFRMWYVAGNQWTEVGDKKLPVYNMRYIESSDGIHWPSQGQVCLDFKNNDEHVVGRPWVYKENGLDKMFLSSRTRSKDYRLGYAESKDGIDWRRMDELVGIDVSDTGWDSRAIAYASIFTREGHTYIFYNGNDCGRTGFGYAICEH